MITSRNEIASWLCEMKKAHLLEMPLLALFSDSSSAYFNGSHADPISSRIQAGGELSSPCSSFPAFKKLIKLSFRLISLAYSDDKAKKGIFGTYFNSVLQNNYNLLQANFTLNFLQLAKKHSSLFLIACRPVFQSVIKQLMSDQYDRIMDESRQLANRMRNGTGAATLLQAQNAPTHHIDALERFQKDFATYERMRREEEKQRRQSELERKRIEVLERENKRWEVVENYQQKLKEREQYSGLNQMMGVKRTANSNGLAYNPITLQYDRNPQGQKLKRMDEDTKIRGFVRAHNMDNKGNSKYNPLTGQDRIGIEAIIPQDLNGRYEQKKFEHYDNLRLKVPPSSANDGRSRVYSNYG